MHLLYPKIRAARGLVMGSPTYNYNITPWVKAFIDRLYPFYNFSIPRPGPWSSRLAGEDRHALVFSVCEQHDIAAMGVTLEAMARPIEALGYNVLENLPVTGFFDRGAVRADEAVMSQAWGAGERLAKILMQ